MNITHVVVDLKSGGLEKLIATIALGQREHGHNVNVVCLSAGGDTAEFLQDKGIPVHIAGVQTVRPVSVKKVHNLFLSTHTDIAHLHTMPAGAFGRLAVAGTRIKSLYHVHTILSVAHRMTRKEMIQEWTLSHLKGHILAISEAVKRDMVERIKVNPHKISVLSGGVQDETSIDKIKARNQFDIADDASVIVCLASLTKVKDHKTLLEGVARVPDALLLLAGEGPLREKIECRASRDDLKGRVRLLGQIRDVSPLLAASDMVAMTSYPREGLSLALVEAARAGRPAVVTNVGGMPEVVQNGITGFVVPPRNPEALASAFSRLLNHPGTAQKFGSVARERFLQRYELTPYLSRLEQLYQML